MISDSLSRIVHELTAGARAMSHLSTWIAEDISELGYDLPDNVQENIALLQSRANRSRTMLADLLAYARLGSGQTPFDGDWQDLLQMVSIDIPDLTHFDVVQALDAQPRMDTEDLRQVITALLSNAVKHHDHATGRITLSCQPTAKGSILCVEDDGPGIPPEFIARASGILTTYQQRDAVEGSGMGLATCARVAELYDGSLAISAGQQGRGCCVTLTVSDADQVGASTVA